MNTMALFALSTLAALAAPSSNRVTPPKTQPVLFAHGVVTAAPTFNPDGKTVYFTRKGAIVISRLCGTTWSEPEVAPFSGRWRDSDPAMSPDGSFMIFASNRPAVKDGAALDGEWGEPRTSHPGLGANLWRVELRGKTWGQPTRLPDTVNRGTAVMEPSIVADGSLYFMDAHLPGNFRFYRSQLQGGSYLEPVPLPFSDGSHSDWDLTVSADETFMVFASDRPPVRAEHGDDLFMAFREGGWREIIHLTTVNDPRTGSIKPRLGPDSRTLYFLSDRETGTTGVKPALSNVWRIDLTPVLRR